MPAFPNLAFDEIAIIKFLLVALQLLTNGIIVWMSGKTPYHVKLTA